MTAAHSDRAHALWSASATSRNWNCSGALALGETVNHLDVESEAAGWGTAAHEISEKCLHSGADAASLIGTTVKTKSHSFEVDDEMAETAQAYVDYVRQQRTAAGERGELWIEERFSLAKLDPPFEAGGTCDAIIYNPDLKLLEVIDLKGGRGVKVEVNENKQLRTYALGALLAHPDLDVIQVKSTIVQPRIEHKDGRIRSETFHVTELMEWTAELIERMQAAAMAKSALGLVVGALGREAWAASWLKPGDHCTFCPAAGVCPALEAKALKTANAFFNDSGKLTLRNQPDEADPARLADILDGLDSLEDWIKAKRALANRLAETGVEIANPATGSRYYLADKFGHRKFKADVDTAALNDIGLDHTQYMAAPKFASPAQVEKTVGKKGMAAIRKQFDALVEKPKIGRTLVSASKSDKQPAKPAAEAFFT